MEDLGRSVSGGGGFEVGLVDFSKIKRDSRI